MKTLFKFLLNTQFKLNQAKSAQAISGFTMIELLIGTIIAFLIIGPLLGFVVSILNDDVREQSKSAGEFELQAAIDYMSEDVSQAYYIYTPDQLEDVGPLPNPDRGEPLLVFWKLKRLRDAVPPASEIDNTDPINCNPDICDDASVRALVAYYLVEDNSPIWCQPEGDNCPKRIVRYEFNDGLKKPGGIYYSEGEAKKSQVKDDGYNEGFDQQLLFEDSEESRREATNNVTTGTFDSNGDVLINYVDIDPDEFRIPLADPDDPDDLEPLQRVKFQIRLNSLRRTDANAKSCTDDNPPIGSCPRASIEVEGLKIKN